MRRISVIFILLPINRAGGLYGRILTEVVSTDRTQWCLSQYACISSVCINGHIWKSFGVRHAAATKGSRALWRALIPDNFSHLTSNVCVCTVKIISVVSISSSPSHYGPALFCLETSVWSWSLGVVRCSLLLMAEYVFLFFFGVCVTLPLCPWCE